MPPIGTSRGYGSNPDDDNEASAPVVSYEMHEHEEEVGGHGHEAPVNPDWIEPSDSTLDDVYISAGKRPIDPAPIGWMTPDRILDNMIPPPLAYAIDWRRIIVWCSAQSSRRPSTGRHAWSASVSILASASVSP
jgi:hypothetical protein